MKVLVAVVCVCLLAAGGATVAALTTGEHVACGTATAVSPPHTVGVDGTDVSTIPGATATTQVCVTATDQTVTVTEPGTTATTVPTTTTVPITTTVPTTTTSSAAPLFDGRANQMTSLGCNPNSQSPAKWDGLGYVNCDITIVPDSRYGKVFRMHINEASKAPYYDPGANKGAVELSAYTKPQGGNLGHWDWYQLAIKLDPSWKQPTWNTMFEPNFPRYTSPPIAINTAYFDSSGTRIWTYSRVGSNTNYWELWRYTGRIGSLHQEDLRIRPAIPGHWVEFVLGVKWALDNTGAYKLYTRDVDAGETAWTKNFDVTGVVTYQTNGGAVPADLTDIDMLYSGTEPENGWPLPLWDNVIYQNGYRHFTTEADALAATP